MNYTVAVIGGGLLLALGYYYFPVYGGVHWFTGPVNTVGQGGRRGPGEKVVDGTEVRERKGSDE